MSAIEIARQSTTVARHDGPSAITNIGQLFEALAVDFNNPNGSCRTLIAMEWPKQFVRTQTGLEIPVYSGNYMMRGFIRFESTSMFDGLFETHVSDDMEFMSARLTDAGYEFAKSGLLAFDGTERHVMEQPFFTPSLRAANCVLPIGKSAVASITEGHP